MNPSSHHPGSLAVITGATGGVGLEIAKGLARSGYDIIVGARRLCGPPRSRDEAAISPAGPLVCWTLLARRDSRALPQPSPGTADAVVVLRDNVTHRPLSPITAEAADSALTLAARNKER